MRIAHAAGLIGTSYLLLACSGSAPATKTPPESRAQAAASAKTKVGSPTRSALEIHESPGDLSGVIDARRFRSSSLFTAALVAFDGTRYDNFELRFERACGFKLFDTIGLVTYRAGSSSGVLAIDVNTTRDQTYACVKEVLGPLPSARIGGEPALLVDPEAKLFALYDGGVLLVGDEELLASFHRASPETPAARARHGLRPDELARIDVAASPRLPPEISALTARVVSTKDELSANARARAREAGTAATLAASLSARAKQQKESLEKNGASDGAALLDSVKLTSEGDDVLVALGVKGDAIAQTKYLANLTTLATYELNRYALATKVVEARATVATIAQAIVTAAEREPGGKGKRGAPCPPTAARVPKTTPKGDVFQSASADWADGSWKQIGFSIDQPQRFSYEIVSTKDRRSCKVIAHGDLDGNGKESRLELEVRLEKNHVTTGKLVETDPEE